MAIEITEITTETVRDFTEDLHELRKRMAKPQRHRLLHGYARHSGVMDSNGGVSCRLPSLSMVDISGP
jgi:hypothetical protein